MPRLENKRQKASKKWALTRKEKTLVALILEKPYITNKELAERLGYKDTTSASRAKSRPPVAEALERVLMEPIERMRDAKRLAVDKLLELLKSRDPNDVKYAIDRILAAEINVIRAQLDVNIDKHERYIVEVKQADGTVTVYQDDEENEKETH